MLDLMGSDYVLDYCVDAALQDNENKLLTVYFTDVLRGILSGVCHLGNVDVEIPRWLDWQKDDRPAEKQKTSDEIISSIKDTLRKLGGEGNGVDTV